MSSLLCAPAFLSFWVSVAGMAMPQAGAALPPEAAELRKVGYGARSRGGEGGRVVWVTTLDDRGPGSLREALQLKEPRIIKFKVGGTIKLKTRLHAEGAGRVTVDGLTAAPYGGVTVEGGLMFQRCEDVIVRHVRFRGGYDPLSVVTSKRALIDHCSTSWSDDENLSAWDSEDVTFQWCIIAEGAVDGNHEEGPHSMGSLQGGGARRVTTHHCLFTGNMDRNPLVSGNTKPRTGADALVRYDVINNVVYNCWNNAKTGGRGARVNFIGNYFRLGPDSSPSKAEIIMSPADEARGEPRVYLRNNLGPHRPTDDLDQHALLVIYAKDNRRASRFGVYAPEARKFISKKPFESEPYARLAAEPAGKAYASVLRHAGAWPRDDVDRRLIQEVKDKKGKMGRVGPRWRAIFEEYQARKKAGENK